MTTIDICAGVMKMDADDDDDDDDDKDNNKRVWWWLVLEMVVVGRTAVDRDRKSVCVR